MMPAWNWNNAHCDRNNDRLNADIEKFIEVWGGTAIGAGVKNMYENGDSYEHICEAMQIDYEDYEED